MTQSEKALEKQEKCHQNWCASTRNAGAQSVTWRQQQRLPVPAGARERLQLGLTPGSTCRSWAQSKRSLQADPTLLQSRVLFQLWCLSPALVHRQCNLRVKPLNSVATQPQPSTYRLHYSAKSQPQARPRHRTGSGLLPAMRLQQLPRLPVPAAPHAARQLMAAQPEMRSSGPHTHPSSMSIGVPSGSRSSADTSWLIRLCDWGSRLRVWGGTSAEWAE